MFYQQNDRQAAACTKTTWISDVIVFCSYRLLTGHARNVANLFNRAIYCSKHWMWLDFDIKSFRLCVYTLFIRLSITLRYRVSTDILTVYRMAFEHRCHAAFVIWSMLLFCVTLADESSNLSKLMCLNGKIQQATEMPSDLPQALSLARNYKVHFKYADLIHFAFSWSSVTLMFFRMRRQRSRNRTTRMCWLFTKNSWALMRRFTSKMDYSIQKVSHNDQQQYSECLDGECSKVNTNASHSIYNVSDHLRTLLKNDASTMQQILGGLLNLNFSNTRTNGNITWVDGIETVSWYGCINETEKTPGVEIGVKFVGKLSKLKSYSKYENPVVASVSIIVYKGIMLSCKSQKHAMLSRQLDCSKEHHLHWKALIQCRWIGIHQAGTQSWCCQGTCPTLFHILCLASTRSILFQHDCFQVTVHSSRPFPNSNWVC